MVAKAKTVYVNVSSIVPNKYRDMATYPINKDKVDELRASYKKTGVWPTIVCRKVGSKYQLAFGHHRWIAAKAEEIKQIPVNVMELSDADMLRMMADENSEDWGSNASIDQETIRAVVYAVAENEIDLSEHIPAKTSSANFLYAPHVCRQKDAPSGETDHRYTKLSVAKFLGWTKKDRSTVAPNARFEVAWRALELIEQEVTKDEDYRGLSRQQADEVNRESHKAWQDHQRQADLWEKRRQEAEKAKREAATEAQKRRADEAAKAADKAAKAELKQAAKEAEKVTKHVANKFRSGEIGVRGGAAAAREVRSDNGRPAPPPNVCKLGDRVSSKVAEFLNGDDRLLAELKAVIMYRNDLSNSERNRLSSNLRKLADRCEKYADQVDKEAPRGKATTQLLLS